MKEICEKAWRHGKTITHHKWLVMKSCFAAGLYVQGLLHDLSKYALSEFLVGARYYQGDRSPNNAEREEKGYSSSWLHHKGRNRHHYEYWTDYTLDDAERIIAPVPMPRRYVAEMFLDRVAASKTYNRDGYTDAAPLSYYQKSKDRTPQLLHEQTRVQLEELLTMLEQKGERETLRYIRRDFLGKPPAWVDALVLSAAALCGGKLLGCLRRGKRKDA